MRDLFCTSIILALISTGCGDDGGSGDGDTGSADGTGGSASSGNTGPQPPAPGEPGECVEGCDVDDDCGFGIGLLVCKNGACVRPSCADAGCTGLGFPESYICVPKGNRWACVEGCEDDGSCASDLKACVAMADDGTPYCIVDLTCDTDGDCADGWSCHPINGLDQCMPACTGDAECQDGNACIPVADDGAGICQQPECTTDDECDGGHCEDHACICATTDECSSGDVCIAAD